MLKEAIGTGDTVEAAFDAACRALGVESHEAEFEILELPVKKRFGLFGGSPAKVRAYIRETPADAAAQYLRNILEKMGLYNITVAAEEQEDGALLRLTGDDVGVVIGHRGETLDALQYLSGLVANHVGGAYYRVTLDIGNYREKRKETLEHLGRRMAEKAVRTGRNCPLEPMNPYERRIIHTAVQEVEGAKSWSEGEEQARHVVIGPVDGERQQARPRNNHRRPPRGSKAEGQAPRRPRAPQERRAPERPAPAAPQHTEPARPARPAESPAAPAAAAPKKKHVPLYGRIDVQKKTEE